MRKVILVAEDEVFVGLDIADELVLSGLDVDGPFHGVEQALDAVRRRLPDCAVLDVRLSDGDVFPLADELSRRGVPLVFHSGHMTKAELRRRYPSANVCEKPCPTPRLVEVVRDVLERAATGAVAEGSAGPGGADGDGMFAPA